MSEAPGLLDEYVDFLRHHRGLADSTIHIHQRHVEPFLLHLGEKATAEGLHDVPPTAVHSFVLARAGPLQHSNKQALCGALRSFLRFSHMRGYVRGSLVDAVPTIRTYKLARLPRALPWDAITQILDSVDRTLPIGKRDYALILLLVTYGLRIGEAHQLRLDDIDWRHDRLSIRQRKVDVPLLLPLTVDVGEALITYLRDGRPSVMHREVFLSMHPPHRYAASSSLGKVVRRLIKRAGISGKYRGPHVLRHSVASRLLQHGHSIKEIADLLGHRSIESTFIYTKIDIEHLREAALELPEVQS